MRIRVLMAAGLLVCGCQGSSVATAPATRAAGSAATREAATQAEEVGGYTHEGAVGLYRAAKYQQAEAMCLKAIADIEKSKGAKARELASPLDDLATVYLRLARYEAAKPAIERAESVLDKSKPEDAILLGRIAINKGWRRYALGDVRGAEKVFIEARDLIQKHEKQDTVELAELINNIGLMYDDADIPGDMPDAKRVTAARVMLLKSWQMRKKLTGEESAESGESLNNIGLHMLYHAEGDEALETAMATLKKALEVSEKVYGEDHPDTAMSHVNLALGLKLMDDDAGAEEHLRKAMAMTEKFLGKDHPDRAYALLVLGRIEQGRENYKEAEADLLEAVRIYEVTYGANHANVANPLEDLQELYGEMNEEAKEKAVGKRIEKLRGKEI